MAMQCGALACIMEGFAEGLAMGHTTECRAKGCATAFRIAPQNHHCGNITATMRIYLYVL